MPKGFKFPFRIVEGKPQKAEGKDLAASEMGQLMSQDKGERVYQPGNGLNLSQYLFENNTAIIRANMRRDTLVAGSKYINRSQIISVNTDISIENGEDVINLIVVWKYNRQKFAVERPLSDLQTLN